MKNITRSLAVALFLSMLVAGSLWAQGGTFDVEKAIAAGDHKGMATYYRSQADAQRQLAQRHDKMKVAYRNTHVHYKGMENVLAGHCGDLKYLALQAAEQYEDLAKEEDKLAAQPQK